MSDAQIPDDELKALEREVGDLLAEAESLGNQLAEEVGSSPAATTPKPADEWNDDDISGRLAEAEAAAQQAAEELGCAAPPVTKPKKISLPPRGAPRPAAAGPDKSIPNAAELAQPASASPASTQPASAAAVPRDNPPRGGAAVSSPTKGAPTSSTAGVERLVAARIEQPVVQLPPGPTWRDRLQPLMAPLSAMGKAIVATAHGVTVALELLDRPFQRISYGTRSALGWCALAMITAAIAIYAFIVR